MRSRAAPYISARRSHHPLRPMQFFGLCAVGAALALLCAARVGAFSPAFESCGLTKPYNIPGSREQTFYASMRASASPDCRDRAWSYVCARAHALATGMSENAFFCLLNCEGRTATVCPDVMFITGSSCPQMTPSHCQMAITTFSAELVA